MVNSTLCRPLPDLMELPFQCRETDKKETVGTEIKAEFPGVATSVKGIKGKKVTGDEAALD